MGSYTSDSSDMNLLDDFSNFIDQLNIRRPERTQSRHHSAAVARHFGHESPIDSFLEPQSNSSPKSPYNVEIEEFEVADAIHVEEFHKSKFTSGNISFDIGNIQKTNTTGFRSFTSPTGVPNTEELNTLLSTGDVKTRYLDGRSALSPAVSTTSTYCPSQNIFDQFIIVTLEANQIFDNQTEKKAFLYSPKITYRFDGQASRHYQTGENIVSDMNLRDKSSRNLSSSMKFQSSDLKDSPLNEQNILDNIPLFCFPELANDDTVEGHEPGPDLKFNGETFSFVLTDSEEYKRFGYCRRISKKISPVLRSMKRGASEFIGSMSGINSNIEVGKAKNPNNIAANSKNGEKVYCIISSTGSLPFYSQILDLIESVVVSHPGNDRVIGLLLGEIYSHQFPAPGRELVLNLNSMKSQDFVPFSTWKLKRPVESSYEHVSFKELFECIGLNSIGAFSDNSPDSPFSKLILILSAVLMERHVILSSKSLQRLSTCANALIALIHPFEWQHIFIPVLPRRILEFLCSPTAYVVGVLSRDLHKFVSPQTRRRKPNNPALGSIVRFMSNSSLKAQDSQTDLMPIDEAMVVDLDSGEIIRHDTEYLDSRLFPAFLKKKLRNMLLKAFKSEELPPMAVNIKKSSVMRCDSLPNLGQSNPDQGFSSINRLLQKNAAIADALMNFFFFFIGSYRSFMIVELLPKPAIEADGYKRTILARFDYESFIECHPLLTGHQDSVWLLDPKSKTTDNSRIPQTKAEKNGVKNFLKTLASTNNFQYFIQQHEEGFDYYYRQRQNSVSDRKFEKELESPETKKNFKALTKSKFEKMVSFYETLA